MAKTSKPRSPRASGAKGTRAASTNTARVPAKAAAARKKAQRRNTKASQENAVAAARFFVTVAGGVATIHDALSGESKHVSKSVSQALGSAIRSFEVAAVKLASAKPSAAEASGYKSIPATPVTATRTKPGAPNNLAATKGAKARNAAKPASSSAALPTAKPQSADNLPGEVGKFLPFYPEGGTAPGAESMTRKFFAQEKRWGYVIERDGETIGMLTFENPNIWVLSPQSKALRRPEIKTSIHKNPVGAFIRVRTTWHGVLERPRRRQAVQA